MVKKINNDYIETYTSKNFYFDNISLDTIDIEDIAVSLSRLCRFAGHIKYHYSVGQHSIWCSRLCDEKFAMHALLHDASEAYISDLTRPFKQLVPKYKQYEDKIMTAIAKKFQFKLSKKSHDAVKKVDDIMLATEAFNFLKSKAKNWKLSEKPLSVELAPWVAEYTYDKFLERFYELGGVR